MSNSNQSNILKQFSGDVSKQYSNNIGRLVKSLPSNLLILPLCIFLMSPSQSNAIFLYGAIFLSLMGMITTREVGIDEPDFIRNVPSFHGMALGYYAGYMTLQSFYKSKTAYVLSSVVFCIILSVILAAKLYGSDAAGKNILNVGGGTLIGFFVGCLFSYFEVKSKDNCPDDEYTS